MNNRDQPYKDAEMKVEVTNYCLHGRCRFCSPLFRPTVQEAETRLFLERLDGHLDTYLKGGGRAIILTGGGEPLDAPEKLFGALKLIEQKRITLGVDVHLLTVYTNGVKLLKHLSSSSPETYLDQLVSHGVRDLNLSVHDLTEEGRTRVSGAAMGRLDFDHIIPSIVDRGLRVMTRTTLTKGGIDSVEKIEEFVRWMSRLGVHLIYFSDLFQVPVRTEQTTPGSQKVLTWTDEQRVAFDELVEDLKQDHRYICFSETTRHNHQGRTFEFGRMKCKARILLGDLVIGNEPEGEITYAYVKPDGSMDTHNNARQSDARSFQEHDAIRPYRPGRDDL